MADARRTYTSTLRTALFVPLAVGVVGALIILARRSALPDPVAVHWSGSVPDTFSSVVGAALMTAVLSGGIGGAIAASAAFMTLPRGQRRAMLGVGIGVAVAIALTMVWLVLGQVGLEDAHQAVLRPASFVAAGLAGLAAGVLGSRLLPVD